MRYIVVQNLLRSKNLIKSKLTIINYVANLILHVFFRKKLNYVDTGCR